MKATISIVFMVAGAAVAGQWQRNTFPGQGHVDNGFAPGAGWSHTQAVMDISVSPSDPNFRAMLENEWGAVYTEDGLNYKPLNMPHIGTPGCRALSAEFSPHDPDTIYLRVAHDYWTSMDPTNSPAGLWRSNDRCQTWQHLYQPPAGGYEFNSANNAGRTRMLEDPCPLRTNHLYFGTTSDGLVRSTDGGATWETVVPELSNRRIKTVVAATNASNETILYAIAEKIMPRQIAGEDVPLAFWEPPSSYHTRWKFNQNLNDSSGNGHDLSGSVAGWTDSTIEGTYAALFDGSSSLASTNLVYSETQWRLSVSAWVQTTNANDQSIISFDQNEYWELGMGSTGRLLWTVRDSGGTVNELLGPRIDDGDWHHVGAVFKGGSMRLYVDGAQVAEGSAGTSMLGSGNTVAGVVGAGLKGGLDDVRIYSLLNMDLEDAQQFYLDDDKKNPITQGQLWRIRVDASGSISEAVRLHAPLADFHDVDVNPLDPSQGWVIRKCIPFGYPFGGRELYRFSDSGETLTPSTAALGASKTFDVVMVNPGNTNHVFLACGVSAKSGLRWSMDGGTTWQGLDRQVGNFLPSIKSWLPMDYKTYASGLEASSKLEHRGVPFSFVPGDPGKLLWIEQTEGGLLQSDDYGATWRTYAAGGPNKGLGQIAVAQSDPDHWSVGLGEHGFSVTTNNGLSWYAETHHNNALLETLAELAVADGVGWTRARFGEGVAFHPTNPDIMVATWSENSYILRSTDAGLSWSDTGYRNPMALGVDVFWSRTDPNRVYAGRMKSDDAGVTWSDIGKVVISVCDSDSDLIVGVDGMRNDVTADLNLYVSSNGGASWTLLPDPPRETVPGTANQWGVTTTARARAMADALVAIDPGSASLRILLAGRSGIYEYNGVSNAWTLRNTGLENSMHYNLIEPVPWMGFVAFDPRPGFEHIVYAASQNDNATKGAWSGEENPNHAYPGGENSEPFYRSVDGGITWEHLHGAAYPDAPGGGMIESMTIDSLGRMFAATTDGIYIFPGADAGSDGKLIDFTNGTYPDGRLDSNAGWDGGGAGWVVTEPVGLVVDDSVGDNKVIYQPAASDTAYRVDITFRFAENGTETADWKSVMEIGIAGSEDLYGKLIRRLDVNSARDYQLQMPRGSDLGGDFNGSKFDEVLLGLDETGSDASDLLRLTLSVAKGATSNDPWSASLELYNLTKDSPVASISNKAVDPVDAMFSEAVQGYMNSITANDIVRITGLTVETFRFSTPSGPSAFMLWGAAYGLFSAEGDPDGDGLKNLAEYALGGNPTNANDAGILPTLGETDGWNYVYRRRLDLAAARLVYGVETTTNLLSGVWTNAGTVEIDAGVIDAEFESVTNAVDMTGKPQTFIRLKIIEE